MHNLISVPVAGIRIRLRGVMFLTLAHQLQGGAEAHALQGARRLAQRRKDVFLLSELAEQSGGKHFSVDNLEDLPAISPQIGQELRSQYVLGYTPPSMEKDGKYHKIKLMLTSPLQALELRYRRGYYSPQP